MLTSAQIMTDCAKNIWIKTSSYNAATWLSENWVSFQVATALAAIFGCDLFKWSQGSFLSFCTSATKMVVLFPLFMDRPMRPSIYICWSGRMQFRLCITCSVRSLFCNMSSAACLTAKAVLERCPETSTELENQFYSQNLQLPSRIWLHEWLPDDRHCSNFE